MSSTVGIRFRDKARLKEIGMVLAKNLGGSLSQEEILSRIIDFVGNHSLELVGFVKKEAASPSLKDDDFWNPRIAFSMGRTDAHAHNRLLYGLKG